MSEKFVVYGHAFVPVKVRVEIEADNVDEAMEKANARYNKFSCKDHIVNGSEDYGAAFGFDALNAEKA